MLETPRPRSVRVRATLAVLVVTGLGLGACRSAERPRNPEEACAEACVSRAASHCSDHECARGCRFVLDRLVEHEGERILACVSNAKGPCDDALFAECAVHIGEHADGGPPPPLPPEDD